MGLFDEDMPVKPAEAVITVGEDLSRQSESELTHRIAALLEEVNRTKSELEQRSNIRDAANSIFDK